jgi:hypothetical protein
MTGQRVLATSLALILVTGALDFGCVALVAGSPPFSSTLFISRLRLIHLVLYYCENPAAEEIEAWAAEVSNEISGSETIGRGEGGREMGEQTESDACNISPGDAVLLDTKGCGWGLRLLASALSCT